MIVHPQNVEQSRFLLVFLAQRGVVLPDSSDLRFIARTNREKQIVGVVAFNAFAGRTCAMHVAGDGNWLSRDFLRASFHYPFVASDCVQIIVTVAGDNSKSLRFCRHIGFEVLYRIADGWRRGVDMVILHMRRSACRWLREEEHEHRQAA